MAQKTKKRKWTFDRFSGAVAKITGSPSAFLIAFAVVIIWAVSGPFFGFSDTWQLVINTGTTIITFLMVFLIQQAQNKDTMALQLKMDELIAATKGASNKVLNIEDLTEEELSAMKKFYTELGKISEREGKLGASHSLDEVRKDIFKKQNTRLPGQQPREQ